MRRRRAERLVLRAGAAADNGRLPEARDALAEARQLVPSLPDFDRLERKLSAAVEAHATEATVTLPVEETPVDETPAAETPAVDVPIVGAPVVSAPVVDAPVVDAPIVDVVAADVRVAALPDAEPSIADRPIQMAIAERSSSGWKNTLTAIAAMLVLLAAGGFFAFTLFFRPVEPLTSRDLRTAAQLIDAPAAALVPPVVDPPKTEPLPAVEAIEPTGTAGYVEPPSPAVSNPAAATRLAESAQAARLVNVTLPPSTGRPSAETQPSGSATPSADVKSAADLKPVAAAPPPDPPRDRVERVGTPDVPKVPVNTVPDTRIAESATPAPAPAPSAPPAATPAAPPAASPAIAQDALVKATLDRYAAAYSKLDADAAQRVWPRVNRDALARAFDGLASQRVSLADCRINVTGNTASARCAGWTTWQPKFGNGEPRTDQRTWTFELAKSGEDWLIVNARVQNR